MKCTSIIISESHDQLDQRLTHRQVASQLGIGRARVFYQEQVALRKIRDLFGRHGIASATDLEESSLRILPEDESIGSRREPSYSPLHGWLKVNRIVSLNDGMTHAVEVVRAYQLLKESNDKLLRPPLLRMSRS